MYPLFGTGDEYINEIDWASLVSNWRLFGAGTIDSATLQKTPATIYKADDLIKFLIFGTNQTDVVLPEYPWTASKLFRIAPDLRELGRMLTNQRHLPLADVIELALAEYKQLINKLDMVN
jgi:hypothetical protein